MKAEQNELITRMGPGTPCGDLMRRYWQPVALVDEFNPALDPRMGVRPVKAVRLLGQDLVLFKDAAAAGACWTATARTAAPTCPLAARGRRPALPFPRLEVRGAAGRCLDTPAEPTGSTLCERVRQRSYPVHRAAGVVFAGWARRK
jgi:phthalate 4,5-dioxygenase oxygenase subunit